MPSMITQLSYISLCSHFTSTNLYRQICKAKCATKASADPYLQPFTEEVERGRPVPQGKYYIPISGAPEQCLGSEEKKLRQKLQKYTPAALSHWKVDVNDPFARKVAPLKQAHPDIISGTFRAEQGSYEPEYVNPLLEQRLDPSMPEQHWSVSLREAMSHESGVYEDENADDGQKYMVENTVIERQIAADFPGVGARSSPCPSGQSGPSPCRLPPSGPGPSGRSDSSPSGSGARPCPAPCSRTSPDLSRPCNDRSPSPQLTRLPCKAKYSKQPSSPLVQPDLPSNLSPQINPLAQSVPIIALQQPTPQLQPSPCHPEIEHSVNEQMVPAPRMQSPVGDINAQKTINMQRLLQASPQGTKVLTLLRGTNLESPGQAKQIDIMKQENLPPPAPSRLLSPQVAAPYKQISPQLQYVMPPRQECYSPQMRTSPERYYAPPGSYASPPPSPLLIHRGQLPQAYTPPMYGMTAQQRYPSPRSPMIPSLQPTYPFKQSPGSGQRPVTAQGGFSLLKVPGSGTKSVTPIKTPSKMTPMVTPIRLEAAAPVPLSPVDASLDVVRRLVDEERQDVVVSQELPPPLTRKLNMLKKKPQSMRVLEETLDQSIPIDEESETMKPDVIAELMYSQETGVINTASSPRKTYEQLFPPLEDEQPIAVSPAAPAPLHDIVVPMGEATIDSVAVVNEDIKEISEAVAEGTEEIPQANAFAEAIKNDKNGQLTSQSPPREHKSREERSGEEGSAEEGAAAATPAKERDQGAEYIRRGELEEQKAPWDIKLGSLEDLVGGKMSMMSAWNNLPSDESVRATAGRLEYILDVQKPRHHSCVQLRGSQMPAWFPGFYSVLPQVDGFVRLERTPSRAFASAWHVFAPYQSAEQSEVVIL